jgi:hypothetical protein
MNLRLGRKVVGSKWVFRTKYNTDGSVERRKARLLPQGFTQRKGLDYEETFSPVVRFASFRVLMSLAASADFEINQFDITTAFLYGDLHETT